MTRAYSIDLRERVVNAALSGATVREATSLFGVAVCRLCFRLRLTDSRPNPASELLASAPPMHCSKEVL